jgi:hypothetical protein
MFHQSCDTPGFFRCLEPPMNAQGPTDLKNLKTHAAILMACTLDCIWCLRNKVVHGTTPINLPLIVKGLELRIAEHLSSLSTVRFATAPLDPVMVWSPPPAGSIKINTDVAVHANFSTLAVIARDHQGFVLKAWSSKYLSMDPTTSEAAAIKWALTLAKEECFSNIIVESDSLCCIDAINGSNLNAPGRLVLFALILVT